MEERRKKISEKQKHTLKLLIEQWSTGALRSWEGWLDGNSFSMGGGRAETPAASFQINQITFWKDKINPEVLSKIENEARFLGFLVENDDALRISDPELSNIF